MSELIELLMLQVLKFDFFFFIYLHFPINFYLLWVMETCVFGRKKKFFKKCVDSSW